LVVLHSQKHETGHPSQSEPEACHWLRAHSRLSGIRETIVGEIGDRAEMENDFAFGCYKMG
jgi:hypothetical protein